MCTTVSHVYLFQRVEHADGDHRKSFANLESVPPTKLFSMAS